jgi:hypothetical protein
MFGLATWGEGVDPQLHNFKNFLFLVWRFLNLPSPTPVQYDIADFLQDPSDEKIIIMGFRGMGKSWVTAAFICWCLLMNPNIRILVASGAKDKADEISEFMQRLISEMPELAHLKPKGDSASWSKVKFFVNGASADIAPSVKSAGILGAITGSRANVILGDDVETPNNSETQGMRTKLFERTKEFDSIIKPGGKIIYLGTPQTTDTLYRKLAGTGFKTRIWPVQIPTAEEQVQYGDTLAPFIKQMIADGAEPKTPTEPSRFTEEIIDGKLMTYGKAGFALQFMLNPSLSDADKYPLKVKDLLVTQLDIERAPEVMNWMPHPSLKLPVSNLAMQGDFFYSAAGTQGDHLPYTGAILAIDPSGRGGDETGYAVVKFLNGYLYVTDCGGLRGGYEDDTLTSLCNIAKKHKVNRVLIEANFGDGMFTKLITPFFRRIYPVTLEEVKHSIQKEKRIIDTLEPLLMQHRLVFHEDIIERDYETIQQYVPDKRIHYSLIYQMTRITKDRGSLTHDDRLDALAMGCSYWVDQVAADAVQRMEDRERAEQEKLMNDYLSAIGHGQPVNNQTMFNRR